MKMPVSRNDPAQVPEPVPADVVIALAAGVAGAGLRLGGHAIAGLGVALRPALSTEHWPRPVQDLAMTGARLRCRALAATTATFRRAAPAVVMAVLDELDLAGIVREVVYEIDLPEIIRASGGSLAGQMVREARVRIMAADDVVGRHRT